MDQLLEFFQTNAGQDLVDAFIGVKVVLGECGIFEDGDDIRWDGRRCCAPSPASLRASWRPTRSRSSKYGGLRHRSRALYEGGSRSVVDLAHLHHLPRGTTANDRDPVTVEVTAMFGAVVPKEDAASTARLRRTVNVSHSPTRIPVGSSGTPSHASDRAWTGTGQVGHAGRFWIATPSNGDDVEDPQEWPDGGFHVLNSLPGFARRRERHKKNPGAGWPRGSRFGR